MRFIRFGARTALGTAPASAGGVRSNSRPGTVRLPDHVSVADPQSPPAHLLAPKTDVLKRKVPDAPA